LVSHVAPISARLRLETSNDKRTHTKSIPIEFEFYVNVAKGNTDVP